MASYQIPVLECFNFAKPDEWPKWIRRFERFRQASGVAAKSEESQVNTLIYSMGEKADDIFQSFELSADDSKKYDTVKGKFETHFVKRRNTIFERAKFNSRKQEQGEAVDDFIVDLYALAEPCQYGNLREEMIRDRIVVGIRDGRLAEKLQLDAALTLDKVVTEARQSEAVKKQQSTVREGSAGQPAGVSEVRRQHGYKPKHFGEQVKPSASCPRCGKGPIHPKQKCPAREATCNNCHKKGHYQAVCRNKKPAKVRSVQNDEDKDDVFMGTIQSNVDSTKAKEMPWMTKVTINGHREIEFKVDTGADVTVIPPSFYNAEQDGKLSSSTRTLTGPGQQTLEVIGQFTANLKRSGQDNHTTQDIFVVKGLTRALLGLPAIKALGVVSMVNQVHSEDVANQFPELFTGLGKLRDNYKIKLKSDATPFALTTPRRVALPLLPKVKAELQRMVDLGVIEKIDSPTEWCAGLVVVPKSDGRVRMCVDLTKLNANVCRERLMLPTVEYILAQIGDAKYFSKLDANSGFWQVELDPESRELTTFITPFGRYCFNRLPFGITSGPEHFQRRMSETLQGMDGVVCLIDDVLIAGKTKEDHDARLTAVLTRISKSGLTLNKPKCMFGATQIRFLGQLVDQSGARPDPDKVQTIQEMKAPTTVSEVRRFLGMVNQLSKFCPDLAEHTKPLRDLLSTKNAWLWSHSQEEAFQYLKTALSNSEVLALYNTSYRTVVSADASAYGIGAVLRQEQPNKKLQPVAYISRALTPTEQRYAQIEKEALAVTWASERFRDYLIGLHFEMQTDHKPLVSLLGSKNIDELPVRIQRFRMRLMRFDYTVVHVPGKDLNTADTLSRLPDLKTDSTAVDFENEVEAYVDFVMDHLPATEKKLQEIAREQDKDPLCKLAKEYCSSEWPGKSHLKGPIKAFAKVKEELCVAKGLLLRGDRVVIPTSLQQDILDKIHSGHQGLVKCRQRASCSVWWPKLHEQIEKAVARCPVCVQHRSQAVLPLIPSTFPERPWKKVGTDLFEWKSSTYLLVVDYYSRFIETAKLTTATSFDVITHLKSNFARYGIPDTVVSDNGPQYSAADFSNFAMQYGFTHVTSSPKYPQANGEAERAVQTVKNLLKKSDDPYLAMLAYRSTPLENGYSPAELLMGRRLRTMIPTIAKQLAPKLPKGSKLQGKEGRMRQRQKNNFDQHHRAKEL